MSTVSKNIKGLRLKNGLTLLEVAKYLGVQEATVQRYESGKIKHLKHETICKLAELFHCDPSHIMGWNEDDSYAEIEERLSTNIDTMGLYDRIQSLCRSKGFAISNISENIPNVNISKGSISKWKSGAIPRASTLKAIAEYFGVSVDYLLGKTEDCAIRSNISGTLKKLRERNGLTADQVGAIIGRSGKAVNAWENNRGQPNIESLMRLCEIYKVDNILAEFSMNYSHVELDLTMHEKELIMAYRSNPTMQIAVDKLLDIEE